MNRKCTKGVIGLFVTNAPQLLLSALLSSAGFALCNPHIERLIKHEGGTLHSSHETVPAGRLQPADHCPPLLQMSVIFNRRGKTDGKYTLTKENMAALLPGNERLKPLMAFALNPISLQPFRALLWR